MYMWDSEYVLLERRKDLQRAAARLRLIKTLERERSAEGGLWRKTANALGGQMVAWGVKLQNLSSPVDVMGQTTPECC